MHNRDTHTHTHTHAKQARDWNREKRVRDRQGERESKIANRRGISMPLWKN